MRYDILFYFAILYSIAVIGLIIFMEVVAYKNRSHDSNDPIEILIRWIKSKRDK